MARKIKYYLVAAEALPEIFIRVAEAKRMMQTGEADTVGAATKMAGISRSAFYKYKDAVQPFNDMKSEHIITFYTLLKDVSGTLSSVLGVFAASGANILTINHAREDQNSEVGACIVSMVLETRDANHIEAIRQSLTAGGYPLLDT